jgi:Fe-S cluster biogenesis protein NfuA
LDSRSEIAKQDVEKALTERVVPALAAHGGGAELSWLEAGVAGVRLVGACAGCPSAQMTLEDVVRADLMEAVPGLKDVVLDNSVSEDLIDFAKKILNKQL